MNELYLRKRNKRGYKEDFGARQGRFHNSRVSPAFHAERLPMPLKEFKKIFIHILADPWPVLGVSLKCRAMVRRPFGALGLACWSASQRAGPSKPGRFCRSKRPQRPRSSGAVPPLEQRELWRGR